MKKINIPIKWAQPTLPLDADSFHKSHLESTLKGVRDTEKRFRDLGKDYFIIHFSFSDYVVKKEVLTMFFRKYKAVGYAVLDDVGAYYKGVLLNNIDHRTYIGLTNEVKNNFNQLEFTT